MMIMDARRTIGQAVLPVYILPLNVRRRTVARKIFPVFYNIDPSEVNCESKMGY